MEKKPSTWTLTYEGFKPAEEGLREALCTLGNGYFATRGAPAETFASKIHYPATYMSGVYNCLSTHIAGKTIYNEDLVNCPNWTFLTFRIGNGGWFVPSAAKILSYKQELDMHRGVLTRKIRFKNQKGQKTLLTTRRIVHMGDPHFGAMEYIITPENYSEWITVRRMLDGAVLNTGVERYRQLNSKHWRWRASGTFGRNGIYLAMKTSQSRIEVALASKIRIFAGRDEIRPSIKYIMKGKERIGQEFRFFAKQHQAHSIEKVVSIYTSNDLGVKDPVDSAMEAMAKSHRFETLFESHKAAWEKLWDKCDIHIEGDTFSQRVLRLHIFHLLQTASIHNPGIDAGFPARGLHGEAYRGHIFWDEMFAMPMYDLHLPDTAKALLMYRFRRLSAARDYAKKSGYKGAMYPWQSGSTGKEETQVIHLNPMSGEWGPDHSCRQRHVSLAIAYNVWEHYKRVGDLDFLKKYGAEMILSISQFFVSLTKYDPKDKRYHIKGVMGPDEFHEKFPGFTKPGLKDNAYTNIMVVWLLLRARDVLELLPEKRIFRLMKKLKLTDKDFKRWQDITKKMSIPMNEDGVISQFVGYFDLKELDWDEYRRAYDDIHRMDRILKAEGKSPDEYKVAKQADALMAFYILPLSDIKEIFKGLGYEFKKDMLRKNYEYYIKRTSHGSTLSRVVHCFIAHQLGRPKEALSWFRDVLESDIYDSQGGTTPEGIHTGVMGGSINIVFRGFAGIDLLGDHVKINPNLPKYWSRLRFKFCYRGHWIAISISHKHVSLLMQGAKGQRLPIEVNGKFYYLSAGVKTKIPLFKRTMYTIARAKMKKK